MVNKTMQQSCLLHKATTILLGELTSKMIFMCLSVHRCICVEDNNYTTDNSTKLAHDLTKFTISDSHGLITLDIKDLYVNIPITETIDIARTHLLKHNNKNIKEEICTLLEMVLQQNYFGPRTNLLTHQRSGHGIPHFSHHC